MDRHPVAVEQYTFTKRQYIEQHNRQKQYIEQHIKIILQKLTRSQLVKKFPAFYGTRSFITASTSARHLSISWASSIHSITPHPTSWRSILILYSHLLLGLQSGLFPSGFPTNTLYTSSLSSIRATCPPILFFCILSPEQYFVSNTYHKAPHYVVFSTPLLPRPS